MKLAFLIKLLSNFYSTFNAGHLFGIHSEKLLTSEVYSVLCVENEVIIVFCNLNIIALFRSNLWIPN